MNGGEDAAGELPAKPRLWLPQDGRPDFGLYLVGGISTDERLYLILEGQAIPPPRTKEEDMQRHVPMLVLRVLTESGEELLLQGSGGGQAWRYRPPGDPTRPLTVRLYNEDGSVIWETVITPE